MSHNCRESCGNATRVVTPLVGSGLDVVLGPVVSCGYPESEHNILGLLQVIDPKYSVVGVAPEGLGAVLRRR